MGRSEAPMSRICEDAFNRLIAAVSVAGAACVATGATAAEREICVTNRTVMIATAFRQVPGSAANGGMANLERLDVIPGGKTVCLKPKPALAADQKLVVGAARSTHAVCRLPDGAAAAAAVRLEYAGRGACRPVRDAK